MNLDPTPRPAALRGAETPALIQRSAARAVVVATVSLLTLAGCSDRAKDTHPQQWVSKRQALFKDFTRTLEPLGLMARERQPFDPKAAQAAALRLQSLSLQPWPLFTADSNYPPTQARTAVWDQPEPFKQAQESFAASVTQLVAATQPGTLAALRPAVETVQQRCKECHDQFRQR